MSWWTYRWIDTEGRLQQAQAEWPDRERLRQQLQAEGARVVWVRSAWLAGWRRSRLQARLRNELPEQLQSLAQLLEAGVDVHRALNVLLEQAQSRAWEAMLGELALRVRRGESPAQAVSHWPGLFDPAAQAMLHAGERGGRLAESLREIAALEASRLQFQQDVHQQLRQPLLSLWLLLLSSGMVISQVLPPLADLASHSDFALNGGAEWLLRLADGSVFPVAASSLCIGVLLLWSMPCRRCLEVWKLVGPGRRFWKVAAAARFARVLSGLYRQQVPMEEAMALAAKAAGVPMRDALWEARERVLKGQRLTEAFNSVTGLPGIVLQALHLAEQGAALDVMLELAARQLDAQLSRQRQRVKAFAGPVVLLIGGGLLAWLILVVMLPVYSALPELVSSQGF